MALVIDDRLLIDVLADSHEDWLRREMEHSAVYMTGAWYYRVASAAHHGSGTGSLSGRLGRLHPEQQQATLARIDELPEWIRMPTRPERTRIRDGAPVQIHRCLRDVGLEVWRSTPSDSPSVSHFVIRSQHGFCDLGPPR